MNNYNIVYNKLHNKISNVINNLFSVNKSVLIFSIDSGICVLLSPLIRRASLRCIIFFFEEHN
jgi:hypothetical protein